jgi:hypothetical protein
VRILLALAVTAVAVVRGPVGVVHRGMGRGLLQEGLEGDVLFTSSRITLVLGTLLNTHDTQERSPLAYP